MGIGERLSRLVWKASEKFPMLGSQREPEEVDHGEVVSRWLTMEAAREEAARLDRWDPSRTEFYFGAVCLEDPWLVKRYRRGQGLPGSEIVHGFPPPGA